MEPGQNIVRMTLRIRSMYMANQSCLGRFLLQKTWRITVLSEPHGFLGATGKILSIRFLPFHARCRLVRVVNDQVGKPTYTVDLANKVPEIIVYDPGIYHITNDGQCSWYEFASAFIPNATPCSTEEFPRKAKRPAYSVLVNTKTPPLRHWKEAVKEYIQTKERT